MGKDLEEVTRLINLYIEGAGKGSAEKLNEAFHSSARWFGTMGGVDYDVDKAGFIDLMVGSPGDAAEGSDHGYSNRWNCSCGNCERRRFLGNALIYQLFHALSS